MIRAISYGGGVQSSAMIVLATQGKIDASEALFCNVGDDSEHPATITYVREVMTPWAAERGIAVRELEWVRRDGTIRTLYQELTREGSRTLPIPVRMAPSGAPGNRSCTATYKIKVIERWAKQNGATEEQPATTYIGISTDEILRLNNRRPGRYTVPAYPLIDLNLSRDNCRRIISDAGLPVPPKSACYFCPFHTDQSWRNLHEQNPDLFERAAALEDLLNARRESLGKNSVYLTRHGVPLRDTIDKDQLVLIPLGADGCDSGHCFT